MQSIFINYNLPARKRADLIKTRGYLTTKTHRDKRKEDKSRRNSLTKFFPLGKQKRSIIPESKYAKTKMFHHKGASFRDAVGLLRPINHQQVPMQYMYI